MGAQPPAMARQKAQPVQMPGLAPQETQCLSIHAGSEEVPRRGYEHKDSSPAPPAHPLCCQPAALDLCCQRPLGLAVLCGDNQGSILLSLDPIPGGVGNPQRRGRVFSSMSHTL